jgi:hypothetical protein
MNRLLCRIILPCFLFLAGNPRVSGADGVFVRFQVVEPAKTTWYVKVGGYIHNEPWYLAEAIWPTGADTSEAKRLHSGEFSPWFDLGTHAGPRLHGRLHRAGGGWRNSRT